MTTTVQMLKDRPDGAGGTYRAGTTYTLTSDLADFFVRNGAARRVTVESEETGAVATLNPDGKRYDVQDGDLGPVFARKSVTGGVAKLWSGTHAQYDAIATKADDTLYIIVAG